MIWPIDERARRNASDTSASNAGEPWAAAAGFLRFLTIPLGSKHIAIPVFETSAQLYGCAIVQRMPQVPHPLPDDLAELIARRFRVLSDPTRIRLLDSLRDGGMTVAELQYATGASQQNVSKHLGVLLQAGLVARRREGNFARYEIADDSVFELCEQVCGGLRRQVSELDAILQGA